MKFSRNMFFAAFAVAAVCVGDVSAVNTMRKGQMSDGRILNATECLSNPTTAMVTLLYMNGHGKVEKKLGVENTEAVDTGVATLVGGGDLYNAAIAAGTDRFLTAAGNTSYGEAVANKVTASKGSSWEQWSRWGWKFVRIGGSMVAAGYVREAADGIIVRTEKVIVNGLPKSD